MAEILSERHISNKAFIGPVAGAIIFAIAVISIRIGTGKGLTPGWLLIALLPLPLTLLQAFLVRLSTGYRLFPDRLEVESGLTSRSIENIDLFRVRDVGVKQSLIGRIFNYGDVYLHSTDSSTPDLHIKGIDAPSDFYRQLRERVDASRAQRQTMIIEGSQAIPE